MEEILACFPCNAEFHQSFLSAHVEAFHVSQRNEDVVILACYCDYSVTSNHKNSMIQHCFVKGHDLKDVQVRFNDFLNNEKTRIMDILEEGLKLISNTNEAATFSAEDDSQIFDKESGNNAVEKTPKQQNIPCKQEAIDKSNSFDELFEDGTLQDLTEEEPPNEVSLEEQNEQLAEKEQNEVNLINSSQTEKAGQIQTSPKRGLNKSPQQQTEPKISGKKRRRPRQSSLDSGSEDDLANLSNDSWMESESAKSSVEPIRKEKRGGRPAKRTDKTEDAIKKSGCTDQLFTIEQLQEETAEQQELNQQVPVSPTRKNKAYQKDEPMKPAAKRGRPPKCSRVPEEAKKHVENQLKIQFPDVSGEANTQAEKPKRGRPKKRLETELSSNSQHIKDENKEPVKRESKRQASKAPYEAENDSKARRLMGEVGSKQKMKASCGLCDKQITFVNTASLKLISALNHVVSHVPPTQYFSCPKGDFSTNRKSVVRKHVASHGDSTLSYQLIATEKDADAIRDRLKEAFPSIDVEKNCNFFSKLA